MSNLIDAITSAPHTTNTRYSYITDDLGFDSDFIRFTCESDEEFLAHFSDLPSILQENTSTDDGTSRNSNHDDGVDISMSHMLQVNCNKKAKRGKGDEDCRIAFRMKTELEITDDGYKWRKYGKKMVKDNPNPRNYYKCSNQGCNVKKTVQREMKDSSYVIITYEGIHNHETPSLMYYNSQIQLT